MTHLTRSKKLMNYRDTWCAQICHESRGQESIPQSQSCQPQPEEQADKIQAALASHPDKVAVEERESAEIRFKSVSQAYEILSDEETRHLYDTHGMAAFEKGGASGMPDDFDVNDIFASMFAGGGGAQFPFGSGGGFGFDPHGGMPGGGARRKRAKGKSEEKPYEVTLEELYKGKTIKFASTKNVVCSHCKGSGGKEKTKTTTCSTCRGAGKGATRHDDAACH